MDILAFKYFHQVKVWVQKKKKIVDRWVRSKYLLNIYPFLKKEGNLFLIN
jgi:hypothetical protein